MYIFFCISLSVVSLCMFFISIYPYMTLFIYPFRYFSQSIFLRLPFCLYVSLYMFCREFFFLCLSVYVFLYIFSFIFLCKFICILLSLYIFLFISIYRFFHVCFFLIAYRISSSVYSILCHSIFEYHSVFSFLYISLFMALQERYQKRNKESKNKIG